MGSGARLEEQIPASAAQAEMLRQNLGALGTEVSPEVVAASQELLAPFQESEPYGQVDIWRDVAYGIHERQRMDIFSPPERLGGGRPVVVFVHGGSFVAGDKNRGGSPYHDNVALWAVRNGMVGITMNYRLAPEFTWPSGAEDVAAEVAWLRSNVSDYGGNPDCIHLMGTSAGAVHVGSYLAHPRFHLSDGVGVASASLLSGAYDLPSFEHDRLRPYLGGDTTRYADMSLLPGLLDTGVPVLYAIAEFDPPAAQQQALTMVQAYLERHGRWPAFVRLRGSNHFTITAQLNTAFDDLGPHVMAEIRGSAADNGIGGATRPPIPFRSHPGIEERELERDHDFAD